MNYTKIECGHELPTENGTYITELGEISFSVHVIDYGFFDKIKGQYIYPKWWMKPLPEQPVDYVQKGNVIPYQCCPVCQGFGKVLADGFTSSVYKQCEVCNGAKVIPMCLIPIISEQQAVAQSSGVVKLPDTINLSGSYKEFCERLKQLNPRVRFE